MLDSQWPASGAEAEREPLIVWIGKIRRYKCAHHAIKAMPEVVRRVPRARLVIAGRRDDEAYEEELRQLAERLGVAKHVELRLNISDDEKFALLARAQAAVITSPVEGFSIVVIEANRCGTPIVATEGVPRDTAKDGYNGYRVQFNDRVALASALVRVLGDASTFDALTVNARHHAEQFSIERTGPRLDEAIDAALRASAHPSADVSHVASARGRDKAA